MPKAAIKTVLAPETKPKRPREPREVVEVAHPIDVPGGATHFRMRRDGRQGAPCLFMRNGVEIDQIPIRWFTVDKVRDRWGYCSDYWVTFNRLDASGHRNPLGGWKRFRFPDPATRKGPAPPEMQETSTERAPDEEPNMSALMPSATGAALDPWAAMMTIRSMVASDSRDALAAERARADSVLTAERERSRENTAMLLRMFELSMAQARPVAPPARSEEEESAVVRILRADLAHERERVARLEEERETDTDDDEEEGTDAEQLARFGAMAKKEGAVAAFMSFAQEKTVAQLFKLLPDIQTKLPAYWREVQPFLKDLLGAPAPAPAPPAPPQHQPAAMPPPARSNGTAPKRQRPPKDDLTPEVG
jgi:hypothetical protein